eukprot:jgi/Picre1/35321/NNA_002783.t1
MIHIDDDENRAPRNGTVVIDMTGEDKPVLLAENKEEKDAECSNLVFCGVCLQNLEDVNFLLRMKHVKECCRLYGSGKLSEKKMVSGSRALKLFLEYHGCVEYYDKFIASNIVKDLAHVRGMDSHELGRVQSIVGGRKKLELALEHYALHGKLPLRASLLARSGSEKSQKAVKRMKSNKNVSLMGRQKQQKKEAVGNGTVCPSGGLTHRNDRHNFQDCTSRLRRVERMLFVSFYEDNGENDDTKQCGSCRVKLHHHKSVVYRNNGHVTQGESMWVGAGCCGFELRSGSLEKRLALKRGDVREGRGVGNRALQESIAVKKVRLKAMEDELQVQLSTVKELEGMIGSLKKEIDELENTER